MRGDINKEEIERIGQGWGLVRIWIHGSFLRPDQYREGISDIDVLVEPEEDSDLWADEAAISRYGYGTGEPMSLLASDLSLLLADDPDVVQELPFVDVSHPGCWGDAFPKVVGKAVLIWERG